ncbi:MAG: PAS domain S-box protein [Betaproteobacteria bacterium]|nr:PAS domain S-box protein [Betaproteobacteria bacterium]
MDSGVFNTTADRILRILLLEEGAQGAIQIERALTVAALRHLLKCVSSEPGFRSELETRPHAVIVDYHMTTVSWRYALQLTRERFPDIPVILIAGSFTEQQTTEVVMLGATDLISWQHLERLAPAIRTAIRMSELRRYASDVQEQLAQRESDFRGAFQNAAFGTAMTTLDGRWLNANNTLCQFLGYSEAELLATDCNGVTHPDDVAGDVELLKQLVVGRLSSTQREKRYLHKRGHVVWAQVTASLVKAADGKPRYRMLYVLDIKHRMEAENRFRATFEQAAVGIAHASMDEKIIRVNRRYCDIVGYSEQELLGRVPTFLNHPDNNSISQEARQRLTSGAIAHDTQEKRYVRKDGEIVWVKRTESLARDDGGRPQYFIRVIEDISERKQAEERLARADRARRVLTECTRVVARATNESDLLERMCRIIIVSGRYRQGWIGLATGDPMRPLKPAAYAGYGNNEPMTKIPFVTPEGVYRGVAFEALTLGVPVIARDILNAPQHEWRRPRALEHGFQSSIGLPLTAEESVLGVLVMHAGEPDAFDQDEIALLITLAEDVAFGIGSLRKEAARRQTEGRLARVSHARRVMAEGNHVLMHATDETEMLQQMCRISVKSGGYKQAWVGYATEDSSRPVYPAAHAGYGDGDEPMTSSASWTADSRYQGTMGLVLATGEIDIARDIFNEPQHERRRERARQLGCQSAICLPLRNEGRLLGAVAFYAAEPDAFDDEEIALLTEVVDDIAFGVSILRTRIAHRKAEAALRESQEQFSQLAHNIPQVFWITDVEHKRTLFVSSAAEKLLGRPLEEICDNPRSLVRAVHREDRKRVHAARKMALTDGYDVTYRIVRADGAERWVRDRAFPVRDAEGKAYRVAGIAEDITDRRRAEAALQESEAQFRQLAGNIPQVFWITDAAQREPIYLSPAFEKITGRPLAEVLEDPRCWINMIHHEDRQRVRIARRLAAEGRYDEVFRIVRPDGSIRWLHDRAFPVNDATGRVYRITGIAEDITERKGAEEQLMKLAHYDVLTNLPNRVLFYDRLKQALAQAKRNQWSVGVMFIDVDRFKNVNDTMGHSVGDRLLQQISERLMGIVRSGDTVGRLGGDEFSVVLSNLAGAQDANLVAQKMMACFTEPFWLEGTEVYVTASIGITLYPDDSTEQDILIRNADAAMYKAKEIGRDSYQFYTPEMNTRALGILGMENSLRRALDRNEYLLYYQPKVGIANGEITGLEALIRWRHPERGLVSPGEFMSVLEETGLIVQVGQWVLNAVCRQIKEWENAGVQTVPVAVNLSARQFTSKDLGATIKRILEEHQIDSGLIELEITESSLMVNTEEAVRTLEYLSALGVSISIDDFGTGYSSLSYLKRFPLDSLKIDRSFIRDITTDGDDATITRAVISMAHSLGLKVVAEGVETERQLAFLTEYGCDQIQGYFFSHPLPADECGMLLREMRRLRQVSPEHPADTPVVLLVNNDGAALTHLSQSLAKDGYRIFGAYNAHEAFEQLGTQHVDVVIADHNMPGMSGTELLEHIRALFPDTLRIITCASSDFGMRADAAGKEDAARFIASSAGEDELRFEVRVALESRSRMARPIAA